MVNVLPWPGVDGAAVCGHEFAHPGEPRYRSRPLSRAGSALQPVEHVRQDARVDFGPVSATRTVANVPVAATPRWTPSPGRQYRAAFVSGFAIAWCSSPL